MSSMYEIDNVAKELAQKIIALPRQQPMYPSIEALLIKELQRMHDCGIIEVRSEDPDYS